MTWLDLVLLLVLAAALRSGWRAGLLNRLGRWVGLAAGLLASTWTVPLALAHSAELSIGARAAVALTTVVVTIVLLTLVSSLIGAALGQVVARTPLAPLDRAAGGLAGGVLVLVATWLMLPLAAELPGTLGEQARDAAANRVLASVAPTAPDVSGPVRRALDESHVPQIIAELDPPTAAAEPPPSTVLDDAAHERVIAATVRVSARGCDARYDGSGVVVEDGLVLTNAHVVAGARELTVRLSTGREASAEVVAFDADRDLAVLEADTLEVPRLPLGTASARDEVAIVGHPGGQLHPRTAPGRIEQRRTARGRDIYGLDETEREVLFLAARLQPGDSGGPVVAATGDLVGLVFAISPDHETTAYALDRRELDAILDAPRTTGERGRCLPAASG